MLAGDQHGECRWECGEEVELAANNRIWTELKSEIDKGEQYDRFLGFQVSLMTDHGRRRKKNQVKETHLLNQCKSHSIEGKVWITKGASHLKNA